MLDINLFREERGNNPEIIRESLRWRLHVVLVVDEVIRLDKECCARQYELFNLQKDFNKIKKEFAKLTIAGKDATEKMKSTVENKNETAKKEIEVQHGKGALDEKLNSVENLVHDSVPMDNNEDNNEVVQKFKEEERRMEPNLKNHVDLVELLWDC